LLHIDLVPLSRGKFAIIDIEDRDSVLRHNWFAVKHKNTFYTKRNGRDSNRNKKMYYMHREILKATCGMVDHINGNGLDNRKCNLRVCNNRQNQQNRRPQRLSTSQYKGVNWDSINSQWKSRICFNGKQIHIGRFDSEQEAARAYDIKAKELFGEFARLNFAAFKTVGENTVLGNKNYGKEACRPSEIRKENPIRGFSIPQAVAAV